MGVAPTERLTLRRPLSLFLEVNDLEVEEEQILKSRLGDK